jgi:tRNA(Ser,Leu) C12 N-acetylase TAN1
MESLSGLICSCTRTFERSSSSELYYLLNDVFGYKDVKVSPIRNIPGLSIAAFSEDSILVLQKIKAVFEKDKTILQYTLKIVPIQYRVISELESYTQIAKIFAEKIQNNDTWKINIRRRHSQLSRDAIISSIADEINKGKVQLESPKYYIIVEIMGKWTYFALSPIAELSLARENPSEYRDNFYF